MNIEFLERVYVRGLEGIVSDRYLEKLVTNEWTNAVEADEAFQNNFESRNIGIQLFFRMKGWGL